MCKVYLYSRVSTDQQSLAQQERTVYEYLKHRNMSVTEVFSDEGISGGVSYKDRKLGKELLPMMSAGDVLIVSEVSRLGRSMYDLSKLIHEELKPRKVRLIIVGMGIDLDCNNIKPMDSLILSNFSFAAELEKHLISERTKSALAVKRSQGIKLGASSDKYKETRAKRNKKELKECFLERGKLKTEHYLEGRDQQAFLKAIKRVFPDHTTDENPKMWEWKGIRCRCGYTAKLIEVMRDFKEMDSDGSLFKKWDFSDDKSVPRLRAYLQHFKASILR